MTEKEIIAAIEKAVGDAVNEDSLGGLVSEQLKKHLEPISKDMITVGEEPGKETPKGVTMSQYLGDVHRMGSGQAPVFMKAEDMVRGNSNIAPEQLKAIQAALPPEMHKALYTGSDAVGGYLVPTEQSHELLNLVNNWSVVRQLCREIPMKTHQITFPSLTGGLTAYWIPEASADKRDVDPTAFAQSSGFKPESNITLGQVTLNAYVLAVMVPVSNQLLDDSDPAVDAVLNNLFAETLGSAFDIACLRGAGTALDPVTGLANKIATNVLAAGADFDFDDVTDLIFAVYQNAPAITEVPIIGHPKAEKMMLKIKNEDGDYLYRGPNQAGKVPTIWGEPFHRDGNVSTTLGGGSDTRLFAGDFANSAFVGNRMGVIVKANPYANPGFSHNQTYFLAEMRIGFNVTDEARFAVLEGVPTN